MADGSGSGRQPRVMMLGLRGIPDVQGGVEKHVEELSQQFVDKGWDVSVLGRRRYLLTPDPYVWKRVKVFPLWSPASMKFEAVAHTALGVLFAAYHRPDILHIHAVGPALLTPLARLMGLKVVVTHHGYDYDRQKWGGFAKRILKLGEQAGMRFANARIAVSNDIARTMETRYGVPVQAVPNGVTVRRSVTDTGILQKLGLTPRRYIIMVARIVPEKRQHDLITAFAKLADPSVKLVLVGSAEFMAAYSQEVEKLAGNVPGVILAGMQTGDDLAILYENARLFVLPSSHEGMPIALLEAMGVGLPVLASDITANLEIGLPPEDYFPLGDVEQLADAMRSKLATPFNTDKAAEQGSVVEREYGWLSISDQTLGVYNAVLKRKAL
ncbi:glycosyltransferase family 4 protein [Phyllobacterium meliloti]|uniref:glycosyltransferase family 4 protein n=1 Tax=Phyllobacterium meliloti TaxID=555317 RepID=UPI001D1422BB|nr:glycosyltransferase family 4 protein [Phyllobacterium sp. T1293]UGX86202.1 glycosyltransferase family 4 protein [Phyllobacterium sp. T1293]